MINKKIIRKLLMYSMVAGTILTTSCSEKKDIPKPEEKDPVVVVDDQELIKLPADWLKSSSLTNGFPKGIEVYRRTNAYNNKSMNAYCVVFDPKVSDFEFKPILPSKNRKVSELYAEESGTKYVCLNGGFFGTNASYSLVMFNGSILAPNIRSLNRVYNSVSTAYYPTRGAFGVFSDGTSDVSWVYNVGAGNGVLYSYTVPAANALNNAPASQPGQNSPAGAKLWNAVHAIGGSPVLIKDNQINITDKEELIEIDNSSSRARSAIGYTASGKIILLAVEGNNSSGGTGLNLVELAGMMKEMGCAGALNLDGGGSTTLFVNGQQTVKPSDAAGERPVMSAIIIKKR